MWSRAEEIPFVSVLPSDEDSSFPTVKVGTQDLDDLNDAGALSRPYAREHLIGINPLEDFPNSF